MPSPPEEVEEAIRLPWGPKEVMDSSLGKGQPEWLTRFSVDADGAKGAGAWTVYRDNGGQWAVARRPAYWRHSVYQKTEFWLIKKGETFGDRVRSSCLWQGRLNNSIEITMLQTLGERDRIDVRI